MKQMTEQNMINAFGGESMANMRYRHYALQAQKDNFPNVARLFNAIAHAEFIHAGDHYRELVHLEGGFAATSMGTFGPGNTLKNLGLAIAGENFEVTEMYPAYKEIAKLQDEKSAYRSFDWSYQTETKHRALFKRAQTAVAENNDIALNAVQVCEVCGFTLEGEPPDSCPVCTAKKEKFTAFI